MPRRPVGSQDLSMLLRRRTWICYLDHKICNRVLGGSNRDGRVGFGLTCGGQLLVVVQCKVGLSFLSVSHSDLSLSRSLPSVRQVLETGTVEVAEVTGIFLKFSFGLGTGYSGCGQFFGLIQVKLG